MSRWQGTFTALITPFESDKSVDETRLRELVDFQVGGKVEGLVPCGTTGEAATLTNEEHLRVIEVVVEQVAGRVPILAGVGGNNTDNVMLLSKAAESRGADAVLAVAPYYNKPTQEGMVQHFSKVADAVQIPLVLYNVPGRTSSNLLPATALRLAEHGNIIGIKEASGSLPQVMEILDGRPEGFLLLSGEDDLTFAIVALGGDGVVSVVSNEAPLEMSTMVRESLAGNLAEARRQHYRLLGLMQVNFIETSPIPVKAALAMMGLIEEEYRLPLVRLQAGNRERVREELVRLQLVEASGVESGAER